VMHSHPTENCISFVQYSKNCCNWAVSNEMAGNVVCSSCNGNIMQKLDINGHPETS